MYEELVGREEVRCRRYHHPRVLANGLFFVLSLLDVLH
jgi:hypothetical protein